MKKELSWRDYLTPEEAEFLRPLDLRRKALRKELLEIFAQAYPVQNRATQRRRYALRAREAA